MRIRAALSCLFLVAAGCKTAGSSGALKSEDAITPAASAAGALVIAGYLADAPDTKRWLVIEGDRIARIESAAPEGARIIDTEGFIVPGLIDLHNHLNYNVLPLWKEAKGQFVNRFEWRSRAAAKEIYNRAVKFNMTPITDALECAAARYAELEALTGGVTTIQGGSPQVRIATAGSLSCGQAFGPRNIEGKSEILPGKSAKSLVDIVSPFTLKFFQKYVEPKLVATGSYEAALAAAASEPGYADFVKDFETRIRKPVIDGLKDGSLHAVVAHLAEGRRDDAFTQAEYGYLKKYGMAQRGMVVIHGVGMKADDFRHAKESGVNLVWSPFSNLLLYGQTLDVEAAREAGLALSIGSDWTPTGSKSLLHELKIARTYLDRSKIAISNDELLAMATVNPAAALGIGDRFGKVAEGYVADLLVVAKGAVTAADSVLAAEQKDVRLVTIAGKPVYGDAALLKDEPNVEVVKLSGEDCGAEKAFALGAKDGSEDALAAVFPAAVDFRSYAGLTKALHAALDAYRAKVESGAVPGDKGDLATMPSPYTCEDEAYRKRLASFFDVDMKEAQDPARRPGLRERYKLAGEWAP